ncbi:potassium/proton antiporter [Allobacillus sp. GCM10007491]|uniref:Potassium/proton antiporter n=2 Tax=Allobacillus TaxID=1400133 RepID=A0A941HUF3_9BACI|nr:MULTISPECIES: potassium/proton antiporter [Allobacillus]MBR7554872.1 potassium/proton antiporter [Allobacillus saliphilus]MBU6081612.1 potassium/proton antiporter [Allobacillus halotolerans]
MFLDSVGNDQLIILVAFLLISGVLAAKFSSQMGLPSLVLFIAVGMAIGSDGFGWIYFDDADIAQIIGVAALVVILFEGGLQTKWKSMRPAIVPALSLATVGVFITSVLAGLAAHYLLDVPWLHALLLGSIVGSTDAAAVFATFKERNVKPKIASTLEAESGTNDPMAVFLTLIFIEMIVNDSSLFVMIPAFFWQMGVGLILGILLGRFSSFIINKISLESSGLYPILALAFAFMIYSAASLIGASGFLAVYVAGVIVGNSELTYRYPIFQFNEGLAWIAQIFMFMILGLLAFPEQVFEGSIVFSGVMISVFLILVARPIAVFISTIKMGYTFKEKIFISWAGLRGAVPIVLATFPIVAGVEHSETFFNIVFFTVLISALVQGSTITLFAKKLDLLGPKKVTPEHSIELISLGKANAEMVQFQTNETHAVVGNKLRDINFPKKASIAAIVRNGNLITPYGDTEIQEGDYLYILVTRKFKEDLRVILNQKNEDHHDNGVVPKKNKTK